MQKMLSEHPQVHCAETRLFGRHFDVGYGRSPHLPLEEYVQMIGRHYHPPCDQEGREGYFQTLLAKLIETIALHAKEESGKVIYGEKLTPYVGTADHVMDQIWELYPNIRLIHLVRDCRDVVVSGIAHWLQLQDRAADSDSMDIPFSYLLNSWVEIQRAMDNARDRFEHVFEVKYEDMLEDPLGQAARIFSFVGADCQADLIQRCVEETTFEKLSGGRTRGQEDAMSFFRNGTAGQWRDRLSQTQLERIDELAGALLASLGYESTAGLINL